MSAGRRALAGDALIAAAMIAVPLASSSAFADQYTTVKWYLLHALAAAWLLVEVWICRSAGWPSFVRDQRWLVAALALSWVASAFRTGAERGLSPLADRAACAMVVLCAAWAFGRTGRTRALVAGLAVSLLATLVAGLAQATGRPLPAVLASAEGPAAFFGNLNMAAQFVGLALVLVLATPFAGGAPWRTAWNGCRVALAAGSIAYLYLLSSRSVPLALAAAAIALAWDARKRVLALALALMVVVLIAGAWRRPWPGAGPALAAHKSESVAQRVALWSDTLGMIGDRPLGVGAGNFEDAFLPYQARGRLVPQEALVFRSPHDEYLRVAAEDGLPFAALAIVVGALLARRWRAAPPASPELRTLVVAWGAFLAVEAVFQFPLALAFGALAAAMTAGAALAGVESGLAPPPRRGPWRAGATLAALALLAASARVARSEVLSVRAPDDRATQERACALDPRNLPACVTAAWLEARAGEAASARGRLSSVLAGAPHYPPALKLLGEIAALQGDDAEACRRLGAYDALFRGRSSVHHAAAAACAR